MNWDLGTLLRLAACLVVTQAVCWLLARGLGFRLGWRVIAAGLLLPLAFLLPWLGDHRVLAPTDVLSGTVPLGPHLDDPDPHHLLNDAVYQFLPWELEIRHALSAGRLPLWSDLLEGGSSPWSNPQAGVLSPLQIPPRLLPIQHHLLAALALKILVAFQGTWLLARRLGCRRPASALGAVGFALGGGIMSWALFPHTAAGAWVPWLTVGVIGLFRHPSRRLVATTAVLTAALLLSGHPETAAIGGLLATLCGLWLRRRAAPFRKSFGAAALAAALGLALAAPHVLPFLHVLPRSQRAHETLALSLPDAPVRLLEPLTWFLPGHGLFMLTPTNPHAFGRPYRDPFQGPINWADSGSGYAGLIALAGALAALALRDRRARPFLAFALAGLLLAARFLPLAALTLAVPPLRTLAYSRFLLVTSLAFAVAGAIGFDRLLRGGRRARIGIAGVAIAAAVSLLVRVDPHVLLLWALIAAGTLVAVLLPPSRWAPRVAAALLALALILDQVPWSRSLLPAGHPALFYPRTPFIDHLAREAAAPGGPYRLVGAEYLVYPSLLSVYGLADPRTHNPLTAMVQVQVLGAAFGFSPSMVDYFARFGNVDHPLLDFLGVRAVVSSPAMPPSRTLERADDGRYAPFSLYRNPDALPRWFLPSAAEAVPAAEVPDWIARLDDGAKVALLAEEAGDWRPAGLTGRPRAVEAVTAEPGHLVLRLPTPAGVKPAGETLLATSLPGPAGWRASSGTPVTVNGAYLGVRLPAAAAEVELRYRPPGFLVGALACLAALAVCAWLALSRPRSPEGPDADA